jgi:hypothetical protein
MPIRYDKGWRMTWKFYSSVKAWLDGLDHANRAERYDEPLRRQQLLSAIERMTENDR